MIYSFVSNHQLNDANSCITADCIFQLFGVFVRLFFFFLLPYFGKYMAQSYDEHSCSKRLLEEIKDAEQKISLKI